MAGPWRPLLRRDRPFSDVWGADRGTPVDRLYIDGFIAEHAADIGGRVLEVQEARYALRHGTSMTSVDVLDIDAGNRSATIVADLCDPDDLPPEAFDCAIVPQTLQYVRDPAAALRALARTLAPGGVLLATVPGIIAGDGRHADRDRWRFTEVSVRELAAAAFGDEAVETRAAGNFAAAVAFLGGMALEELPPGRLAAHDARYTISIGLRATKAQMIDR